MLSSRVLLCFVEQWPVCRKRTFEWSLTLKVFPYPAVPSNIDSTPPYVGRARSYNKELKEQKTRLDKYESDLQTVKQVVDSSMTDLKGNISEIVSRQIKEHKDNERRRSNIIVYNVAESQEVESKNRFEEDMSKMSEFLEKELRVKANIVSCHRLGKKNQEDESEEPGSPRPLRVMFSNSSEKFLVNKEAMKLKSQGQELSYPFSGDYTAAEREEYRKLKQELERRKQGGERDIKIKKGKIVKD